MEYKEVVELILRHLAGTITPDEEDRLKAWRESSKGNEALFARLCNPDYLQREYRKSRQVDYKRPLKEMEARIRSPFRRQLRMWQGVAATAVILLSFSLLWNVFSTTEREPGEVAEEQIVPGSMKSVIRLANGEVLEMDADTVANRQKLMACRQAAPVSPQALNEVIVPRGGVFKVVLEDSTVVWLNADSKLVYPENFSEAERKVSVQGEAYFQVAHRDGQPFIVETDGQLVRVLGTEFNIHSYEDDGEVRTTLVEGSIAMMPKDNPSAQLLLTPGHQAAFSKQEQTINVNAVNVETETCWRKGMVAFDNLTLGQIMKSLSRWYDFDYEFADVAAADIVFMGQMTCYADFTDICSLIEKTGNIRITQHGRTITISSKK